MNKSHFVYKHRVWLLLPEHKYSVLITVYSCSDYYVKYPWNSRSLRVTKDYLRIMFPEWYKDCGLFHVEQSDERG